MTAADDDAMSPGEARVLRAVLFTSAAVNLMFWAARERLSLGAAAPLWEQALFSAVCVFVGAATWTGPRGRRAADAGLQLLAYGGTVWWTHQTAANGLTGDDAVGSLLAPAIISLLFRSAGAHLGYALFSLVVGAVEYLPVRDPQVPPGLFLLSMASVLGMMHVELRTRLAAPGGAGGVERLSQALSSLAGEALILLDPGDRTVQEANGGARVLLGAGAGSPAAALQGAVGELLGPEGWGQAAAALARGATYRRAGPWRAADGREVAGELTVSRERVGRREAWLLRIAAAGGEPARAPAPAGRGEDGPADLRPDELRMNRTVLLAGAGLLPLFWAVHRLSGSAAPSDPLWQRLAIAGLCVLVAGASHARGPARALVRPAVAALAVLASLWWIRLAALTGLRPAYATGLIVLPAVVGAGLHRPLAHLAYAVVVMAAAAAVLPGVPEPGVRPAFVLLSLGAMLLLMHLLLRVRLRAYDDGLERADLREIMFERISEALALADPIRGSVLVANRRARDLFGLTPGPAVPALGELVAGEPDLRPLHLVRVNRAIADHGAYRRTLAVPVPGGRALAGELAVTTGRAGHRDLWLIRVLARPA